MNFKNILETLKSRMRYNNHIAAAAANEQQYQDSMCWKISPSMYEEKTDHILLNDKTYVRTLLVGVSSDDKDGYPRKINKNLIDNLASLNAHGCTITHSVAFMKSPVNKASMMLKRAITTNQANQIASKKSSALGNVDLTLQYNFEDLAQNLKVVHKGNQNMFHTVYTIVISANSMEALRVAEGRLILRLSAHNIETELPFGEQLNVWKNAMPLPGYYTKGSVEMFSHEAAVIAPIRSPNTLTDISGLYFGNDKVTKKRILIDLKKLVARHLFFIGATGSGKTFTMLMLLMRAHDMLDMRIVFITDKDDKKTNYGAVPKYYNGSYIKIGPNLDDLNINPMQILFDSSLMKSSYDYVLAYNNHKGILQQFFKEWFKGDITINQVSLLDSYIDKVYENAGIYKDNPSTWINAAWPVLNDLRELSNKDKKENVTAQAIYDKTYQLSNKGELAYINNPTNIDLSKDFTVIDMSGVPEIMKGPMAIIVIGILGLRFRTDTVKETIIAVDEAGSLMRNPAVTNFLLALLIKGRSYALALWLATQQPTDLEKAGVSSEFKTNMIINIILGKKMDKLSVPIVQKYFMLNDDEIHMLLSSDVGVGLLMVDQKSFNICFKPTDQEFDIISGTAKKISSETDININPLLLKLAIENGFFATNWINGDAGSYLTKNNFIPRKATNPVGRGTTVVWIKSDIIKGEKIGTQSVDHYATVMMIAAHLIELGWTADVHHMLTADILAEYKEVQLSVEYERPGSHNKKELRDKAEVIKNEGRSSLFVTQSDNFNQVKGAVEGDTVVKRGGMLIEHIENLMT